MTGQAPSIADAGQQMSRPRGNRFVNCLVARPCACASGIMALCLVTIIGTGMIVRREGAGVFSSGRTNDLNDIRTMEWEAYEQARDMVKFWSQDKEEEESDCVIERWGQEPRPCDTKVYPSLTQRGDIVLTAMLTNGKTNLLTESGIKQLKAIEDKIVQHNEFANYCMRWDKSGMDTSCAQPISPLGIFYADLGASGTSDLFDQVDALDGSKDGELKVFETAGLSENLSAIQSSYMQTMRSFMQGGPTSCTSSGVGNPVAMSQPGTQTCLMDAAMASMTVSATSKDLYKAMLPLVTALRGPRGEILQDVDKTLKLAAHMKTVGFYSPMVDYYFDKDFSVQNPVSKHSRGMIQFGLPLPGYNNSDDRSAEQREKFRKWFRKEFNDFLQSTSKEGDVEFLFFATPLIREEFLAILVGDMLKVVVSLGLVFLWIFIQTNSIIIAIAGITEIILSIPLAFFFYYTIFGFKYFDGLNAMTIFIVAAIGADDIFVFMDQYKMSSYNREACVDLKTRMNWVYARASWAMFITSATTCAAFICTAVSPLPNIQSFGIFSAFVIAADYLLVISWFPAVLILYHNNLEARPCCPCCCFGAGEDQACKVGLRVNELWPCKRDMQTSTSKVFQRGPDEQPTKRMMERALSGPFAGFLGSRYGSIGTVVTFLILLIPASILASQIQPLSRSEESLPADHPFQKLWTISGEEFPSSAQNTNTPVHVVWGVKGMNNEGISILRQGAEAAGKMEWDNTFKFDEAAQRHILNVCDEVRKMQAPGLVDFLSRDTDSLGKVDCPLDHWKTWLERPGGPGFPLPLEKVKDEMPAFLESETKNDFNQKVKLKTVIPLGYDAESQRVRVVMVQVESQLQSRASHAGEKLRKYYDRFQTWMDDINGGRLSAPSTANKAFQTCEGDFNGPNWIWMNTQGLFRESAITGACVGTVLAFLVILFATQQIIIAGAAFVTIACILVTVIAMMKIANYEMGSTTSICITILAGFAVDYVVHLAHAYNHSEADTRAEKFQEAFDIIGVSVLSGMVTSVLASAVLLTCSLQFFAKFGFFMIFTVIWAWLWGNCFFMCVVRLIGPDKNMPWYLQLPYSVLPEAPRCCRSEAPPYQKNIEVGKDDLSTE
eukprot:TRINITY_DN47102_c0_g1_i1.p1 TRINITY_DN47102_c0_g1~~TRINITY_DN47102_c0_g1_i1.p1  ORF type:complete len:1116 (-),score=235.19 TRINITY_DN47102_c0_g1_i1:84-3431(-)